MFVKDKPRQPIAEIVLCLEKQGIAFRGHDEGNSSSNLCSVLEMCKFPCRQDAVWFLAGSNVISLSLQRSKWAHTNSFWYGAGEIVRVEATGFLQLLLMKYRDSCKDKWLCTLHSQYGNVWTFAWICWLLWEGRCVKRFLNEHGNVYPCLRLCSVMAQLLLWLR